MEETVGSRIKTLVIAKAMRDGAAEPPTAEQIAAALKVSYESLRKWSAGKTAPNRKRAQQIAAYLGCPPEEFMHGVNFSEDEADGQAAEKAPERSPEAQQVAEQFERLNAEQRRTILALLSLYQPITGLEQAAAQAVGREPTVAPPASTPQPAEKSHASPSAQRGP